MPEAKPETFDEWAVLEEWKPAFGFEGVYEVSDAGRVRRVAGGRGITIGRFLKPQRRSDGYLHVQLWKNNQPQTLLLHRLVATSFIGPVPDGREVNHIDGNKANNRLSNLEYATRTENNLHAYRNGLMHRGEDHYFSKLTDDDVLFIRNAQKQGLGCRKLARRFGVNKSTIVQVQNGKSWSHVRESK